MKAFKVFVVVVASIIVLFGCTVNNPQSPKGFKRCNSDWDCNQDRGEYCDFVHTNEPPVCRK
jgi:hypothetical protein